MRGLKKPGTPYNTEVVELNWFKVGRTEFNHDGGINGACSETRFQNSRSRSTLRLGGLPAISAALIPPIEMPTTQSGAMPASTRPSYAPACTPPALRRPAAAGWCDQIFLFSYFKFLVVMTRFFSFKSSWMPPVACRRKKTKIPQVQKVGSKAGFSEVGETLRSRRSPLFHVQSRRVKHPFGSGTFQVREC